MHMTTRGETRFTHDGDFGGDVAIECRGKAMSVPFADLLGLVAEFVRRVRVARVEGETDREAIGL